MWDFNNCLVYMMSRELVEIYIEMVEKNVEQLGICNENANRNDKSKDDNIWQQDDTNRERILAFDVEFCDDDNLRAMNQVRVLDGDVGFSLWFYYDDDGDGDNGMTNDGD